MSDSLTRNRSTMLMSQINAESFLLRKDSIQPIFEENNAEYQIKPAALIRIMTQSETSSNDRIILTKKASVIGRGCECDFQIPSVEISRRHCLIENKNSRWFITNLNSTNGLFINGTKISNKTVLYDNYIISFGPLSRTMYRYVFYENYDPCSAINKDVGLNDHPKSPASSLSTVNSKNYDQVEDLDKKLKTLKQAIHELSESREKYDSEVKYWKCKHEKIEKDVQKTTEQLVFINEKIKEILQNDLKNVDLSTVSLFEKLKKLLLTELTCSICCEIIQEPLILKCQHTFCSTCIQRWRYQSKKCPICREDLHHFSLDNFGHYSLMFNGILKIFVEYFLNDEELKERQKIIEARKNQIESSSDSESEINDSFSTIFWPINMFQNMFHADYLPRPNESGRRREFLDHLFDQSFFGVENESDYTGGSIAENDHDENANFVADDDVDAIFAVDSGVEANFALDDDDVDSDNHENGSIQTDSSPQLLPRQSSSTEWHSLFRPVNSEPLSRNEQARQRPMLNRSTLHSSHPYDLRNRLSRRQI